MLTAAKKASAGTDASLYVAAFATATLLLPGLLQKAQKLEQKRWLTHSQQSYDAAYISHDLDRPALWAMEQEGPDNVRKDRTYLFGARLRWGIFNEVNASCDASRAAFEVVVALSLFSVTIGLDVAASFVVSAALLGIYGTWSLNRTVTRNEAMAQSSKDLANHLRNSYDNVQLGNHNNYHRWHTKFVDLTQKSQGLEGERARADAIRSLLVLGLARAPVIAALALRLSYTHNIDVRAALGRDIILQLPYLFQMTQRLTGCSELFSRQFLPARAALHSTLQESRKTPGLDLHQFIQGDAITVHSAGHSETFTQAWSDLLEACQSSAGQRFLLTGENGKGKSMVLLALKQALGSQASMLVPANLRELAFPLRKGSTGERVLDALRVAMEQGPSVLLLDEWEAHLDQDHRRSINQTLHHLSLPRSEGGLGRVVVEISHQQR